MLDYKDIITKHYALGMSGAKIAETLGVSKSGVNDFLRESLFYFTVHLTGSSSPLSRLAFCSFYRFTMLQHSPDNLKSRLRYCCRRMR